MVKVSGFLGEMWILGIWKSSIQATPPHGSLRRASDPLVGSMLHSYGCLRPLLMYFFVPKSIGTRAGSAAPLEVHSKYFGIFG